MYKAEIKETIKALSVKERISFTESSTGYSLDDEIRNAENNKFRIKPSNIVAVHIVNDKSEDGEYDRYIFVAENGDVYYSGSNSAYETAKNIVTQIMTAEESGEVVGEWTLEFYKKQGKNQNPFITCSLV